MLHGEMFASRKRKAFSKLVQKNMFLKVFRKAWNSVESHWEKFEFLHGRECDFQILQNVSAGNIIFP
jgi:hypothetical protein